MYSRKVVKFGILGSALLFLSCSESGGPPMGGPNGHILIQTASKSQRIGPEETAIKVSDNGNIVALMPEMSFENTFFLIDNKRKVVVEYVQPGLDFYAMDISRDGGKLLLLVNGEARHSLRMLICDLSKNACRSFYKTERVLITSLSLSDDMNSVYFTSLNVPGFNERPEEFYTFNEFQAGQFSTYLRADRRSFKNNISEIDLKTGISKTLLSDVSLGSPVYQYANGLAFNGFIDGQIDRRSFLPPEDIEYGHSLLEGRGVPILCPYNSSCAVVKIKGDDPNEPYVVQGLHRDGTAFILTNSNSRKPPDKNGRERVYAVGLATGDEFKTRFVRETPPATAFTYDAEASALYYLSTKRYVDALKFANYSDVATRKNSDKWLIFKASAEKAEVMDFSNYSYERSSFEIVE